MLRFIIWMIVVFIAAKFFGQILRAIRLMLTPNRDVRNLRNAPPFGRKRNVEDIPYEEIKEKT